MVMPAALAMAKSITLLVAATVFGLASAVLGDAFFRGCFAGAGVFSVGVTLVAGTSAIFAEGGEVVSFGFLQQRLDS